MHDVGMTPKKFRAYERRQTATWSGASLLFLAGAWETIARVSEFPFLPPITRVLQRLWELIASGQILGNLSTSLTNFAIGLAVCIGVGVPVGIAMGVSRRIRTALDIYVNALLTAPSLVFAPIFFAIFGLGRGAIVSVIITYGLFIIIVSSEGAVKAVQADLVEMATAYGASNRNIVREIVIPSSIPGVMAGIRLGAGRAVKGMINGEMFIAAVGLGAIIIRAGRRFDAETVLAVLIVTIVTALLIGAVIQILDKRLTHWLPDTARQH